MRSRYHLPPGTPDPLLARPSRYSARVYEIRTPADWLALCERYPREYEIPYEWQDLGIRARSRFGADWIEVARDWDAVHVSMSGVLTATDLPMFVGADATLLQGFASDITVWFADCLSEPELIAVLEHAPGRE